MPEYTYVCNQCHKKYSIVSSIRNYRENTECVFCQSNNTNRSYEDDLSTISTTIKLASSEIKTIGHLAHRNAETMSEDQKNELYRKHNSYKEVVPDKPLPKGMNRVKKPKKIKWR